MIIVNITNPGYDYDTGPYLTLETYSKKVCNYSTEHNIGKNKLKYIMF